MADLESLVRAAFGVLTEAEIKLVRETLLGRFAVCGPNWNNADPSNNPGSADTWGGHRHVRAAIIRWICRDPQANALVDPLGIQIYGAKLIGELDLSEVHVPFRVALIRCHASEDILLRGTEIPFLSFDGSWVSAVKADGVNVRGGVRLGRGFRAEKQVRMHRALIGVDLDCGGGTFLNHQGDESERSALAVDGATFGGGV